MPTDLKTYGLDKPAATVRLGIGSSQATLADRQGRGERQRLRQGSVAARGVHDRIVARSTI